MSKIIVLALLFYNVGISFSSEYDPDPYNDRKEDAKFNLLDFLKDSKGRGRENSRESTDRPYLENWTGRWFPSRLDDPVPPPKIFSTPQQRPQDRLPMGAIDGCDDGKTNLQTDWDGSRVNYTCYGSLITPDPSIGPLLYTQTIPLAYLAPHKCMNETIEYDEDIPLYGPHRPVYPVYGEYTFLPKQRWLHSLEHGAVVMLYHPCANPQEIKLLKKLVQRCLRRHIISPYNRLDENRPLALLTWGSRLTMSYVTPRIAINFLRETSLRGPERIPEDGTFDDGLLAKSSIASDFSDSVICPNM